MTKETFIEMYNYLNADSGQTELTPEMLDELWPEELKQQLATAFEDIAKRIEIYKERAAKMTEEEAVSFLTGRVRKIPKDPYEEAYEDWGTEPNRQGFVVYMTQNLLHSIEISILCHKRKEFKAKLKEIIEAYAAEVYPDKEEPKPLPKMPKKPQSYTSPINKLINDLTTKPLVNAGPRDLNVMPDKGKTTYVAIAYEKSKDPFNIPSKQRTIMEAANAVFNQALAEGMQPPVVMTPMTIFKALPGGSSKAAPSKLKEIEETMSLFRDMPVVIDATNELRAAGKIGKGEKFRLKTNMILAREGQFTRSNGTETIGWHVFEAPIACVYAEKMNQVVSCPAWVLEVQEVNEKTGQPTGTLVSVNDNRRELLAYMFRRVGGMLNAYRKAKNAETLKRNRDAGRKWHTIMTAPREVGGYSTSDTILYETAFKAAEIETKRKNTIAELRDYCLKVLTYWKAGGYICDFKELKKGKERRGVKIIFEPPTTE